MKKMLFLYWSIIFFNFTFAQQTHLLKDKKYVQYWESMQDCSIREIVTPGYQGIILDGCLLKQTDKALTSVFESILGKDFTSTITINCTIENADILAFENLLSNIVNSNNNVFAIELLSRGNFYRQYLKLSGNKTDYLFVSFQRNEFINRNKRIQKNNFKLFKLIYSRTFLFKHIDPNTTKNDYFWALYNINKNTIDSFYYNIPEVYKAS